MTTELMHYTAARKALAQARRVDEVRSIHDKAKAMETYAKLAKDNDLLCDAIEIRMRAEVRAGEMLREMKERGERANESGNLRQGPKSRAATSEKLPKLSDLGVSKTQSSRWQKLASLSKQDQERRIKSAQEATGRAIEKATKGTRKKSNAHRRDEDDTPRSYQFRLVRKIRLSIVEALHSLTAPERSDFLELLRLQIDDLKKGG